MLKKLLSLTAVAAVLYVAYDQIVKYNRNMVEVKDICTKDILEMLKENGFKLSLGYDDQVLHFLKDDKSEAIQVKVNEKNKVSLIEYYNEKDGVNVLESVYSHDVVLNKESSEKARLSFLRMLGNIGVTQKRFKKLVVEVLDSPNLADLTI